MVYMHIHIYILEYMTFPHGMVMGQYPGASFIVY